MAQDGYLVISDITGYTSFLSRSELEHAEDSLRGLMNVLIEHTRPPLVISRLEGDAVNSYAPRESFRQGQTLVETIEVTYVAFRKALERMVLNTTCPCNACKLIPDLDLKFFVHYGTFVVQELGGSYDLVGSDVNLAHRLTKNSVTHSTGTKAYALYTKPAVDALGIKDMCVYMEPHTESYEHLGEIMTFVQDLHEVWEREKDRARIFISPEDAVRTYEHEFPVQQTLMWDYLTRPETRAVLLGSRTDKIINKPSGRFGQGTVYYCAHGSSQYRQITVDWQPFEQFSFQDDAPFPGVTALSTVRLTPSDTGTRVSLSMGNSKGPFPMKLAHDLFIRFWPYGGSFRRLEALIEEEIAAGTVVQSSPSAVEVEAVERAVAEGLRSEQAPVG